MPYKVEEEEVTARWRRRRRISKLGFRISDLDIRIFHFPLEELEFPAKPEGFSKKFRSLPPLWLQNHRPRYNSRSPDTHPHLQALTYLQPIGIHPQDRRQHIRHSRCICLCPQLPSTSGTPAFCLQQDSEKLFTKIAIPLQP